MIMKNTVVLTEAGMSAESGISTFRDSGGLWEKYKINDVATPDARRKNPVLVLDFYNQRREQSLNPKSNNGHLGLAKLEENSMFTSSPKMLMTCTKEQKALTCCTFMAN
jgi:NAD-dependent deacetylase